ncbi:MAG: TetR/AcrR family transcriptional regulator [Pseudomonadota bacterium]
MPAPRKPARSAARAGRGALSRDRIETAALALIDADGLEGFSIRKLGEALGCEAMSLYHHFPSKAHLLDALVDRLVDRLVAALPRPPREAPPAARLRALAHAWRALARQHPRFFPFLSVHRLNSVTGVAFLNEVMLTLRDAGLDSERAARLFRAINYYLVGAALDEAGGYGHGPSSLAPVDDATLARDFPALAALGAYADPAQFDRTFDFGLDLLLAALDAPATRRR